MKAKGARADDLSRAVKQATKRARKPRFDRDQWRKEWPRLLAATPEPGELVRRDAPLAISLSDDCKAGLDALAQAWRLSPAGLLLRILCTHLYGRYCLVAMQSEHRGLFARGDDEDPNHGSILRFDRNGKATLNVPQRMFDDLAAQAVHDKADCAVLAGAIVQAHLFGHPFLHEE